MLYEGAARVHPATKVMHGQVLRSWSRSDHSRLQESCRVVPAQVYTALPYPAYCLYIDGVVTFACQDGFLGC
jgi:hypothetical protein